MRLGGSRRPKGFLLKVFRGLRSPVGVATVLLVGSASIACYTSLSTTVNGEPPTSPYPGFVALLPAACEQQLFSGLGQADGSGDVSAAAAAALADMPTGKMRTVLGGLARAHLAEGVPNADGRWRMLDLLRLYAGQLSEKQAEADGRERARDRLLDYYLNTAEAAGNRLRAIPGTDAPG